MRFLSYLREQMLALQSRALAVLIFGLICLTLTSNAKAAVSFSNAWDNHVSNLSTCSTGCNLSVTVSPTVGDYISAYVAFSFSSNQTAPTITPPSGWLTAEKTPYGTPTQTGSRNSSWVYVHKVTSVETSEQFTTTFSAGTGYFGILIIDWGGVNPTTQVDQTSAYTGVSGLTYTAPTVTTTVAQDMIVSCSESAYSKINSLSGGSPTLTSSATDNVSQAPFEYCGYGLQSSAGATTGATFNANSSVTSGQAVTFALESNLATQTVYAEPWEFSGVVFTGQVVATPTPQPTPTPVPAASITPIETYMQSTSACGGGYIEDATGTQDMFWGIRFCQSDASRSTLLSNAFAGGNTQPEIYWNGSQLFCASSSPLQDQSYYNYIYNNPGTNDVNFLHSSSTHNASTRIHNSPGTGHCDASGGSTGTYVYYQNQNGPGVTHYMGLWDSDSNWCNTQTNCVIWFDNQGPSPASNVNGLGTPDEQQTSTILAQQIAGEVNNAGGPIELNRWGPGSTTYAHNNNGISNGLFNWLAGDEYTFCNTLNTNGSANIRGGLAEKALGTATSGHFVSYPFNLKVNINTASVHWSIGSCKNMAYILQGYSGISGVSYIPGRIWGRALQLLTQPNGYNGGLGTVTSVMQQFTPDVQNTASLKEQAIYPEHKLIATGDRKLIHAFCWGNDPSHSPPCDGNGQTGGTGGDKYGNGCYAADSGGVNDEAYCPSGATDEAGGPGVVYYREFTTCFWAGVAEGNCAAVINNSNQSVTISSIGLAGTYNYEVTPTNGTGAYGIVYDDWIHPGAGHHNCDSTVSTSCTGADGWTSVTGSTVIPACTLTNASALRQAYIDWNTNTNSCAVILIQSHP